MSVFFYKKKKEVQPYNAILHCAIRVNGQLQFYTDQNRLEDVMAKMQHDEIGPQLFREFMGLVIPGSGVIMGGFQPHQHLDFVYLSNE